MDGGSTGRVYTGRVNAGARRFVLVLAAIAGMAAVACGDRGDPGGQAADEANTTAGQPSAAASVTSAPAASPAPARAACSVDTGPGIVPGKTSSLSLNSSGTGRTYLLYVPPGYDGSRAMPLVLNFHGLGSNGEQQHLYSGLIPIAEREGFLVASPDGINRSWLLTPGVNDIAFTRDLVAEISRLVCVDPDRVYATGMSNGGFMSAAVACGASDLVAAVAPVAGLTGVSGLCGEPVPFIEFHGTDDRIVPYEAGILAPTGGPFAGVPALMEEWAEHNGCEGDPVERRVSETVVFREYQGCDAPTGHYVIEGGGHTWPGGLAIERLGSTTKEISAAETAWAFFEANPRR